MAIQLTKEAVKAVENDPDLFADVCKALSVKPGSLTVMLRRNGGRLTSYDIVVAISSRSGIQLDQVTEESPADE